MLDFSVSVVHRKNHENADESDAWDIFAIVKCIPTKRHAETTIASTIVTIIVTMEDTITITTIPITTITQQQDHFL
jgi:hypothetical protein